MKNSHLIRDNVGWVVRGREEEQGAHIAALRASGANLLSGLQSHSWHTQVPYNDRKKTAKPPSASPHMAVHRQRTRPKPSQSPSPSAPGPLAPPPPHLDVPRPAPDPTMWIIIRTQQRRTCPRLRIMPCTVCGTVRTGHCSMKRPRVSSNASSIGTSLRGRGVGGRRRKRSDDSRERAT
ncbi:hypothetical protein AcV5_006999 [Taiwanofungus camphoratus]|nr:hypothetical protein AcV5_006999 [Antrodia cinnamomea]